MDECNIAYIGNRTIVTNYYAKTLEQQTKRILLGKNQYYDRLPIEYIKTIGENCERINVYELNKRIEGNQILFNCLIENGITLNRVTTFIGNMSFNTQSKDIIVEDDKYKDFISQEKVGYEASMKIASRLITIAMESLHNLYWKTGKINNWEHIHSKDIENKISLENILMKKYNVSSADKLFTVVKDQQKIEVDEKDVIAYKKFRKYAKKGFEANIYASDRPNQIGHGIFNYYITHNNPKYHELDKNEYYFINLIGYAYQLRYTKKR